MDVPTQSYRNRLLQLLPPDDLRLLQEHLKPVSLAYRQTLYVAHVPIEQVVFPTTGVTSLVNTLTNGSMAEVGTIGNEGVVGLPVVLGDRLAPTGAFVQVPGSGLRLPADVLTEMLARSAALRGVMLHYAHAFFNQVAQSAACNRFHTIQQRCSRWLLMTHDRVQSERFLLTHEFLAMMLGAQRSGVTLAARKLKQKKLIDYRRGEVTILDRHGLEKSSCECYAVSKQEFDRLLGTPLGAANSSNP